MAGLGRKNQIQALYLLIALACVSGLPGTLGYFIKLSLIAPMQESSWFNAMIFISIAIGARVLCAFLSFIFQAKPSLEIQVVNPSPPYSLFAAAVILIILGFFPFVR